MRNVGFCTHFSVTDEWAFAYALKMAEAARANLIICHWLESP
jgi:hypothetical protein